MVSGLIPPPMLRWLRARWRCPSYVVVIRRRAITGERLRRLTECMERQIERVPKGEAAHLVYDTFLSGGAS
jgi:hypothetical protein